MAPVEVGRAESAAGAAPPPPEGAEISRPTAPAAMSAGLPPTLSTVPATFGDVLRLAAAAERAHTAGNADAASAALTELLSVVSEVRARLLVNPLPETHATPPAPPAAIPLPPFRHPFALVIGPGQANRESALAEALETDLATARALCGSRHGRIALRGPDRSDLERRAAAARERGIAARTLARADLLTQPHAETVVGYTADGWLIWPDALWLLPSEPDRRWPVDPVPIGGVFLLVPGEVEVRSARDTAEPSRWLRKQYTGDKVGNERRISVIDLHMPQRILRLVEGVTDTRELPGSDRTSSLRTLRAFPDHAGEWWPDVIVEGRRICPAAPASPSDPPEVNGTGWAAWEEHSRAARILYG